MSAVSLNCTRCGTSVAIGAGFCEECGLQNPTMQANASPAAAPAPVAAMPAAAAAATMPAAAPATVRGTILRDTNSGPGMISVNGQKKTFTLEQHWHGSSAPMVAMPVDVTLDLQGEISMVVPARIGVEDLEKVKEKARQALDGGLPIVVAGIGRIGKPVLAAVLLVLVSWVWLPAVTVTVMAAIKQSATMFDVLRLANSGASLESFGQLGGGSSGLYGVLCVLAMFAPLLPAFVKHKYAPFAYFAPLAFLALVGLTIYLKVNSMASDARDGMRAFGGNRMDEMADAMVQQIMNAISIGVGTYVSLAAAAYLAWRGVQALRLAR